MSVTGSWYLGPPALDRMEDFDALQFAIAAARDEHSAALDRWSQLWLETVDNGAASAGPAIETLVYHGIDGSRYAGVFGTQGSTIVTGLHLRRGAPVAGLFQALGPMRATALPGMLGCIALRAPDVDSALATVRSLLEFHGDERREALARLEAYRRTADGPLDGDELLDALPNALARAAATGSHFVAVTIAC